jgi:hypothetical protein
MGKRHLQHLACRTAARALAAALPQPIGSGNGSDAWYGVESWLPCVRELPMS